MIIAITGANRVGKDTAAEILQKYFPNSIQKSFAEIPRQMYKLLTNIDYATDKELYRDGFIHFCEGMKEYMGTDVFAKALLSKYKPRDKGTFPPDNIGFGGMYIHPNCNGCHKKFSGYKRQYYCKNCILDDTVQSYPIWIISDLRFNSEFSELCKVAEKVCFLEIEKDGVINTAELKLPYLSKVYNNGTIEELEGELINFLKLFELID